MGLDATEIAQGASPTDSAAGEGTDNGQPEGQQPEAQPQTAATAQTNTQQATRQAYDTPAAQELAAIKRELGLPRNAKLETVQRALNDLRDQQGQAQAVDYDNLDPVVAARLEAANEQVWTLTEQVHGDVFTQEARNLFDAALAERNPHDFINRLTQFIEAVTYDPNEESGEGEVGDQGDSTQMPSLGDADVPVSPRQMTNKPDPTLGGRRDSGDMSGFVGDKLRGLGILGPKEPRGA